jgi:hypothetical protein
MFNSSSISRSYLPEQSVLLRIATLAHLNACSPEKGGSPEMAGLKKWQAQQESISSMTTDRPVTGSGIPAAIPSGARNCP